MNQAYYSEFYPLTTGAKGTTVPVVTTGEIVAIQADLNTLGDSVVSISSDTILAKGEKGPVIIEYSRLTNEFNALKTKANALGGFTTQVSNAQTSYNTLTSYLTGLTPAWDNTALDTTIVAATYRTNWIDAYEKVATLNAAIHGLPGAGGLAYRGSVQFNDGSILTSGGGATATDINYQTSLGVAATIASQGTGATANNLTGLNAFEGAKLTGVDVGATAGDNKIRNGSLATDASQWVVTLGTASRVASTTAGDLLAYMRATGGANLVAANNQDKIPAGPGVRLFYSFMARADVQNVAGGGANSRIMYIRQTVYNAAGGVLAYLDAVDASKLAVNNSAGGCGTGWQLHTCYSDMPANAASVKVEFFPVLGSTGAGKFVDFGQVSMTVAQAGADKTVDQLRTSLISDKATSGDNFIRNGDLTTDAGGWLLNSVSWGGVGTVWSSAGGIGALRHTGATSSSVFPNCRPDRTTPNNVADMAVVEAGRELFNSFEYASDGTCTAAIDFWFYSATGTNIAVAIGGIQGTANTAGVRTRVSGKVTVPAGATRMFARVVQAIGAGTYVDMTNFRSSHSDAGATVGAQTGINLLDAGGVSLTDALIKTSLGTAAAIAGQTDWATYTGVSTTTIAGRTQYLSSGGFLTDIDRITNRRITALQRADGTTAVTEAAVITLLGVSSAITGQGALATLNIVDTNTITDGSVTVTELSSTAARLGINVTRIDGITSVTDATAITSLGTAAAITGQADWATYTGVSTTTIAGRTQYLSSGGFLTDIDRITNRRITALQRADGTTAVTEAAVITLLGVSSAITGQAATATSSDFAAITGATKPANGATKNLFSEGTTEPSSPADGYVWTDTAAGRTIKTRIGGAWVVGGDVTATAQIVVVPPSDQTLNREFGGAVIVGQLPYTLTMAVTRGGVSIRTDNAITYSMTVTGGLVGKATINTTAGHADKGRITVPDTVTSAGTCAVTVSYNGTAIGSYAVVINTIDAGPPVNNGAGGGTDTTIGSMTSTSYVALTNTSGGDPVMDVTITSGQSLKGSANFQYHVSGISGNGHEAMCKFQYSPDGTTWTDFAAAVTGGTAYAADADFGEASDSEIIFNQTKTGLAAGTWKVRLVGAKSNGLAGNLVAVSGSATSSIA